MYFMYSNVLKTNPFRLKYTGYEFSPVFRSVLKIQIFLVIFSCPPPLTETWAATVLVYLKIFVVYLRIDVLNMWYNL